MPTGIDKSPYLLVLTAYDYIGLVEYGVDLPVAGCRQLVDAACDLPYSHPKPVALARVVLGRAIALRRDVHLEWSKVQLRQIRTLINPLTRSRFHSCPLCLKHIVRIPDDQHLSMIFSVKEVIRTLIRERTRRSRIREQYV